jgi:hypothetical protein
MRLSLIAKKLTICLSSLGLAGCSLFGSTPAQTPVYCHEWTREEKLQHYNDDVALPHANSLHGIIKDYERVCADLR